MDPGTKSYAFKCFHCDWACTARTGQKRIDGETGGEAARSSLASFDRSIRGRASSVARLGCRGPSTWKGRAGLCILRLLVIPMHTRIMSFSEKMGHHES